MNSTRLPLQRLTVSFVLVLASITQAQDSPPVTTVRLTDKVLVKDCPRLGVHLTGDAAYSAPMLKQRVAENFEGTLYRWVTGLGTKIEGDRTLIGFHPDPQLARWVKGAKYTILSGPDAWRTGVIADVESVETPGKAGAKPSRQMKYILDQPFRPHAKENNLMIEIDRRDQGFNPFLKRSREWADPLVPEIDSRNCSPANTLVQGDVPPGSGGRSVFKIAGTNGRAFANFQGAYASAMPLEGTWRAAFWVKAAASKPTVKFGLADFGGKFVPGGPSKTLQPGDWQRVQQDLVLEKGAKVGILYLCIEATAGDVLIDDVELTFMSDKNPTPFRDAIVDLLRDLNPGVTRFLLNTSGTIDSRVGPPITQYASGINFPGGRVDFGVHDYFQLAEHLKHEPWYTLPGTLTREEVTQFIEYLAAPPDVGLGKLRAQLGHPKPWTDSLHRILIQFGNEVITFAARGYPGPDYWQGLIEAAKKSPHYKPSIVFVVDRQTGAKHVLDNAPAADRLCINSYMMYAFRQEMLKEHDTKEKLARYIAAVPFQCWLQEKNNLTDVKLAAERGKEVSIYEGGNFHTTFGDAPVEAINDILTSQVGGLACTACMLVPLKAYGVRAQNSFNLSQFSFSPGGAFGDIKGNVRLWGGVLESAKGRRFRPRMLQLMAINRAMGGDLVETTHAGADPKFDIEATFTNMYSNIKSPRKDTVKGLAAIQSYGFIDGPRRGLVLMNLDPAASQSVKIEFSGKPAGAAATSWLVSGPDPFADNEPEREQPQVTLQQKAIDGFASGSAVTLPPCSLLTVSWRVE